MSIPSYFDPTKNVWYPRHVSDRADQLIDELDEKHLSLLYDSVREKSFEEWLLWIEDTRDQIVAYDYLSAKDRKKRLQLKEVTVNLALHHACIYVELWRTRLSHSYRPLPPNGTPIDTPESQRELMLSAVASFSNFDARDFWPFEIPNGAEKTKCFPFRES
jgi:hypothetical protein